ncbi:hypothetical protein ANN_20162, partial [Periplaneta americana]
DLDAALVYIRCNEDPAPSFHTASSRGITTRPVQHGFRNNAVLSFLIVHYRTELSSLGIVNAYITVTINANITLVPSSANITVIIKLQIYPYVPILIFNLKLEDFSTLCTAFLRQRISVVIQRGNAISVMGTFPESKSLEEIFYFA